MKKIGLILLSILVLPLAACKEDEDEQVYWYVNSSIGHDSANGEYCCPLRTITEAMDRADKNDIVFVEAGNYTSSTGESFPIVVKENVMIEGNISVKGTDTFIQGGGNYTVTGGSQGSTTVHATFVLRHEARLRGIKITNTGGTGVVVDNATATVEFNTIQGSTGDGLVFFQGGTSPVNNNDILSNGGNGLQTHDTSAPVLRGNNLSSNSSDGVRTHDSSAPDMGTSASFGNNTLQSNLGVGLNHKGTADPLFAIGNIWNPSVQFADSSGGYPQINTPGIVSSSPGNNFAIDSSATSIWGVKNS